MPGFFVKFINQVKNSGQVPNVHVSAFPTSGWFSALNKTITDKTDRNSELLATQGKWVLKFEKTDDGRMQSDTAWDYLIGGLGT